MVSFDDFKTEWLTHRIGDDSLVAGGEETNDTKYQCVSLIKQYLRECFGIEAGAWGNAIDYWSRTNPALLTKFVKDGSGNVQKGDIAILRTLGHVDYTEPGHIGILTGVGDPNSIEILEQNGAGSGTGLGQDAIRTRFIPRNRLAGVLRPIPSIPQPLFVLDPTFQPRLVITNKQPTYKWGLNWDFDYMKDHPVAQRPQGDVFQAVAKVIHVSGHHYYRDTIDDANGYEVADCDDYTPPIINPSPSVVKTPSVPVPLAEKYSLVTTVMYFPSALDAKNKANAQGTLNAGSYIVIAKEDNAYNLTSDNTKNQNKWVNINDNVLPSPPVKDQPTDAPATDVTLPTDTSDNTTPEPVTIITAPKEVIWHWYSADHLPVLFQYRGSLATTIHDLRGVEPDAKLQPGTKGEVSRYAMVDGKTYLIPDKQFEAGHYYGIFKDLMTEIYQPLPDRVEQYAARDIETVSDWLETGFKSASRFISDIKRDVTPQKLQPVVKRVRQSIDGFNKRKVQ